MSARWQKRNDEKWKYFRLLCRVYKGVRSVNYSAWWLLASSSYFDVIPGRIRAAINHTRCRFEHRAERWTPVISVNCGHFSSQNFSHDLLNYFYRQYNICLWSFLILRQKSIQILQKIVDFKKSKNKKLRQSEKVSIQNSKNHQRRTFLDSNYRQRCLV